MSWIDIAAIADIPERGARVVKTPVGCIALFRTGDRWSVYAVEDGRAALRMVDIGHRDAETAEVLGGLTTGTCVVLFPSDTISDGVGVVSRQDPGAPASCASP